MNYPLTRTAALLAGAACLLAAPATSARDDPREPPATVATGPLELTLTAPAAKVPAGTYFKMGVALTNRGKAPLPVLLPVDLSELPGKRAVSYLWLVRKDGAAVREQRWTGCGHMCGVGNESLRTLGPGQSVTVDPRSLAGPAAGFDCLTPGVYEIALTYELALERESDIASPEVLATVGRAPVRRVTSSPVRVEVVAPNK
jgi:hypothetical protein